MTVKEILDEISDKLTNHEDLIEFADKNKLNTTFFDSTYPNLFKSDCIGINVTRELSDFTDTFYEDYVSDPEILENIEKYKDALNKLNIAIYFDSQLCEPNMNFVSTDPIIKYKATLYGGLVPFLKGLCNE